MSPHEGQARWDQLGIPHKGWRFAEMVDRGDAEFTCEMCCKERVRYVHVLTHPAHPRALSVGCVCAGKMTEDYASAEERQRAMVNRAARRKRWLERRWRRGKGGLFLRVRGSQVGRLAAVIEVEGARWLTKLLARDGDWRRGCIGDSEAPYLFDSIDEAKLALFDALFPAKRAQ